MGDIPSSVDHFTSLPFKILTYLRYCIALNFCESFFAICGNFWANFPWVICLAYGHFVKIIVNFFIRILSTCVCALYSMFVLVFVFHKMNTDLAYLTLFFFFSFSLLPLVRFSTGPLSKHAAATAFPQLSSRWDSSSCLAWKYSHSGNIAAKEPKYGTGSLIL